MLSDIEIAKAVWNPKEGETPPLTVTEIAANLGIDEKYIEPYGHYKAKFSEGLIKSLSGKPDGKLILVTAINPTPAGEGKTTISIGLAQALNRSGRKTVLALREPSLGPVFGVKGGAAGGGYSQVIPMEDINLHFTGDMHAITAANNLLSALLDNHIQQGNELRIDTRRILHKRCLDINDRELRNCVVGLGQGSAMNGVAREEHFVITVATEIMAILCLAEDIIDLKRRLSRMLVAYSLDGNPVYAGDLGGVGSMAALLKDAILPNLVQTLEKTPAIIHGGPFANIAHGCNSVRATKIALKLGDYCVTEAGFGSDLGAEKFLDIKCRAAELQPDAIVLTATVRALKYNGGVPKTELTTENIPALEKGIVNLGAHIDNLKKFGVPVVVAINHFAADTEWEIDTVRGYCESKGVKVAFADVFAQGGAGGMELAEAVAAAAQSDAAGYEPLYQLDLPLTQKIEKIAKEIYRADGVNYVGSALKDIANIEKLGGGTLPVCIAKTQYSLSDDPAKLGLPRDYKITVRGAELKNGAGFVVVYTGDIMTMPGLPKVPAANSIDIDANGAMSGLF